MVPLVRVPRMLPRVLKPEDAYRLVAQFDRVTAEGLAAAGREERVAWRAARQSCTPSSARMASRRGARALRVFSSRSDHACLSAS